MVADEQPIICDGFSSTGDAVVSGNPSSNVGTEVGGSDAGAAVGITFAVIVARHVGSAPFNKLPFNRLSTAFLVVPQRTPGYPGRLDAKARASGRVVLRTLWSEELPSRLDPGSGSPWFGRHPVCQRRS